MLHWDNLFLGFFLAAAVMSDLCGRRIPNGLIVAMLIMGLTTQYGLAGWPGVLDGLAGLALGLGIFLPLYIKGGMGAGDAKLMAASGLFLGLKLTVFALFYTLVLGGILATAKLARQGRTAGSAAVRSGIPYAPAIAGGVIASLAHAL